SVRAGTCSRWIGVPCGQHTSRWTCSPRMMRTVTTMLPAMTMDWVCLAEMRTMSEDPTLESMEPTKSPQADSRYGAVTSCQRGGQNVPGNPAEKVIFPDEAVKVCCLVAVRKGGKVCRPFQKS